MSYYPTVRAAKKTMKIISVRAERARISEFLGKKIVYICILQCQNLQLGDLAEIQDFFKTLNEIQEFFPTFSRS